MRFAERTVAIVFEGIGNDVTKSGGIAYAFGRAPSGASDYEWLTDTLIKIPETITTSVDVWTGQVKTSPINVSVANVDLAARKLLYQQARTDDTVTAALLAATDFIELSKTGLSDTVVFVGNEAIKLGYALGNLYACVRGYWGTIAEPHAVGAFVYARNPFLLYRTYRLIVYDHTSQSEQTIQRGYISGIQTNNEGTTIEIACQELLALISRAQLNRGAPKINVTGSVSHNAEIGGQLTNNVDMTSRVWRDDSDKPVWLNVGGTIALGFVVSGEWVPFLTGAAVGANAPEIEFDQLDNAQSSPFSEDAYEMFVIVRSLFGSAASLSSSGGLGASGAFNAVQLAYSFLRSGRGASDSGDDQWAGNWGLGLPAEYFDTAAIEALIADSASDIVQRLILGWDGEAVEIEDLVFNKLLRPRGKFLANTQSGLITIGAISLLDIEEFAGAPILTPIAPRLQLTIDLNGAFSAVAADVGETPWSDPDRIVVESRTAQSQDSSRRALYDTRRELVYDFSTLYAGGDNLGIQATLLSRLMAGIQAVPQVTIDVVESSSATYDLGSWFKIAAPEIHQAWWVDASGERVEFPVTPDAQLTGVLVGRKYNISSGLYTLTLLMMQYRDNKFIRWRAPAGLVVSYANIAGTYHITIAQNEFHAGSSDASKFSPNDYVQLFYADGEPAAGGDGVLVLSVTGNALEVAATIDAPVAGMILRLATFTVYGNGGSPVAGAGRAYVFYADSTTGIIHGSEQADIYG